MSIVEDYQSAHKARLMRLGAPQPKPFVPAKPIPIKPVNHDAGWEGMWFHDLVTGHSKEPRVVRIREIQEAVCKFYDISILDILSGRRTKAVARPRLIGYYLSKNLTLRSLPEIGRRFGGRDHTTILAGIRRIEQLRPSDPKLNADICAITSAVGGQHV